MKVFAIFLFAMANIWQIVYGDQSPNDRELWAKIPRPGQNVCIKPWEAGGHVLWVTGTKYVPVGGRFVNTWTSDAFIMQGWFMSTTDSDRVLSVNVQMQNLLPAEDKADCQSNVKPCYKDNRSPVGDDVAQDWYYYTSMTGTIEAIDGNGDPLTPSPNTVGPDWFLPGSCDLDWTGFYPQIGLGANDKTMDFGGAVWFVCRNESDIELGDSRTHMDFNFNLERGNCECPDEDPDVGNPIDPFVPSIPVFYDPIGCIVNVEDDVVVSKGWACRDTPSGNTQWGMWSAGYKGGRSKHFSLLGEGQIFIGEDGEALVFRGVVEAPDGDQFPFILEYKDPITANQCNQNPDYECPKYPDGQVFEDNGDDEPTIPAECDGSVDGNDWQYYETVMGLIQIEGPSGTINCSIAGIGGPAQLGVGANQHSGKNGTSTWFVIDDEEDAEACGAIFNGQMDFNFNIPDVCLDPFMPVDPQPICVDRYDAKDPTNKGHFLWVRDAKSRYVPGEGGVEAIMGEGGLTMKGTLVKIGSSQKLEFDIQLSDPIDHDMCMAKYNDDYVCGKPEQGGPQEIYQYYQKVDGWIVSFEGKPNSDIDSLTNSTCSFYQPEGKPLAQWGVGANAKDKTDHGFTWWIWCEQRDLAAGHWGDFNIILDADCIPPPEPIFPCVAPLLPTCQTIDDVEDQCTNPNRICIDGSCERKNCANVGTAGSTPEEQAALSQAFCDAVTERKDDGRDRFCDIDDARCRVKRRYNQMCEAGDQCISGICNSNGRCGCKKDCANTNQFCTDENVCVRRLGPGAKCEPGNDFQCRSNLCEDENDGPAVCGCNEDADPNLMECNRNQFCSDSGLCERKLGLKQECSDDTQCFSGKCEGTCKCDANWQCGAKAYCDKDYGVCMRPMGEECPTDPSEECDSGFCDTSSKKHRCGCDENSPDKEQTPENLPMSKGCVSLSKSWGLVNMTCDFASNKCVPANCANTMPGDIHYDSVKCKADEYCNTAKRRCDPKLKTWVKCSANSDCESNVCLDSVNRCGCTTGDHSTCGSGKVCRADNTCQICDTEVDPIAYPDAKCADGKYCNIWMSEDRAYCKNQFNVGIFCDITKGGNDECKSGVCSDNQCRCTPGAGDCGNKACYNDGLCYAKLGKNKDCTGSQPENECKDHLQCRCVVDGVDKPTSTCPTVPKCLNKL